MLDSETNESIPVQILNSKTGKPLDLEKGSVILTPEEKTYFLQSLEYLKSNRAIDKEFANEEQSNFRTIEQSNPQESAYL